MIAPPEPVEGPLLRPNDAAKYLGFGRSTYWRKVAEGALPRPIRLSTRVSGTPKGILDAFIASRDPATIAQREHEAKLDAYREALGMAS